MSTYFVQGRTMDAIADAINAKTGGSSSMTPAQMVTAIGTISGGGSLPTGMTHIGSGSFTFANSTETAVWIQHGLNFTPKFIVCWTTVQVINARLLYGTLSRNFAVVNGTGVATREMFIQDSSTKGVETASGVSDDQDNYITSEAFRFNNSSRFYAGGATYYFFAFA